MDVIHFLPNAPGCIHRPKFIIGFIDYNKIMSKVGHGTGMVGNDSNLAAQWEILSVSGNEPVFFRKFCDG